jgi:hypothetical protein
MLFLLAKSSTTSQQPNTDADTKTDAQQSQQKEDAYRDSHHYLPLENQKPHPKQNSKQQYLSLCALTSFLYNHKETPIDPK